MLTIIQRNTICVWYFLSSKWSCAWLTNVNLTPVTLEPLWRIGYLMGFFFSHGFFSWIKYTRRTQISQCQCYTWLYYKTFRQRVLKLKNMHSSTIGEAERVLNHLLISAFSVNAPQLQSYSASPILLLYSLTTWIWRGLKSNRHVLGYSRLTAYFGFLTLSCYRREGFGFQYFTHL